MNMFDSKEEKILRQTKTKSISVVNKDNKLYLIKKLINDDYISRKMLLNDMMAISILPKNSICPTVIDYELGLQKNYAMYEYIEGTVLQKVKFCNIVDKIKCMLKILDCVAILHKNGVIHCDLKPSNIMIMLNGNIKIIDYDIAIINGINSTPGYGSIKYCSIEQINKEKLDFRSDIYSLGIILYELLLEKLPFDGLSKQEIKNKKILGHYQQTNNEKLNHIFNKTINLNPNDRYNNIDEFRKDLQELLN